MDRLQLYCEPGLKLSETKLSIKQPDQQLLFPCQYVFRVVKYEASLDRVPQCRHRYIMLQPFLFGNPLLQFVIVASPKNCKKAVVAAFQKFHCQN